MNKTELMRKKELMRKTSREIWSALIAEFTRHSHHVVATAENRFPAPKVGNRDSMCS